MKCFVCRSLQFMLWLTLWLADRNRIATCGPWKLNNSKTNKNISIGFKRLFRITPDGLEGLRILAGNEMLSKNLFRWWIQVAIKYFVIIPAFKACPVNVSLVISRCNYTENSEKELIKMNSARTDPLLYFAEFITICLLGSRCRRVCTILARDTSPSDERRHDSPHTNMGTFFIYPFQASIGLLFTGYVNPSISMTLRETNKLILVIWFSHMSPQQKHKRMREDIELFYT